jgi:hypothetical protein
MRFDRSHGRRLSRLLGMQEGADGASGTESESDSACEDEDLT